MRQRCRLNTSVRTGSITLVKRSSTLARRGGVAAFASGFDTPASLKRAGRALAWLERTSYRPATSALRSYPRVWRAARALASDLHADLTFPIFKAAAAAATLTDHLESHALTPRRVALIGDGSGIFGALLLRLMPGLHVYFIDLPRMLYFQACTVGIAMPAAAIEFQGSASGSQPVATFVPSWEVESISEMIDCAVNIASMQEMTEHSRSAFFDFLRKRSRETSRFYCVNREHKLLRGGEVVEFSAYPWQPDDEVFIDGVCPYYTHWLSKHTASAGPRVMGIRVPFVNYLDGVHLHRLVRLAPSKE